MKIVVLSDTHGYNNMIDYVLLEESDADMFIHCGDICTDTHDYPQLITVRGNNDFYDYPETRVIKAGNHRIAVCHSHQFYYMKKQQKMVEFAKKHQCDILCFGHTHVAFDEMIEGIHFFNPGSLHMSRDGRGKSYGVITIEGDVLKTKLIFLNK